MTDNIDENINQYLTSKIPMAKLGTGEDVANTVAFLSSDADHILLEKQYMLMEACIWLDKTVNKLLRINRKGTICLMIFQAK